MTTRPIVSVANRLPIHRTGAAEELREAVSCNPCDVDGLSRRIEHALDLDPTARRRAIRAMAQRVDRHDVHAWLDRQLNAIDAAR